MNKNYFEIADGTKIEYVCVIYPFGRIKITLRNISDVSNLSGSDFSSIKFYNAGNALLSTHAGYTTIYRIDGNNLYLSNDGSVYTDPTESSSQADSGDSEETADEYTPIISDVQASKIASLSQTCKTMIENGVDVEIDGTSHHFSYTAEDQQNLKTVFDLAMQTGLSVPYHADGETCNLFTKEQIVLVYIAEQQNLMHHQTYFNQLKQTVLALEEIDDVYAVTYGQELTGEYLDAYNTMMSQATTLINAVLGNEGGNE